MFDRILAIDIIDILTEDIEIKDQIKKISKAEPIFIKEPKIQELSSSDLQEIDAILVSIYKKLDKEFLRTFPKLRYIGVYGTSIKLIDTAYCATQNIKVVAVKEYCDDETAEWVILQILKFYRERPEPLSLSGKSLAIIGRGQVGKKLLSRASALDMKILLKEDNKEDNKEDDLLRLFANADAISLHTPAHVIWLESRYLERMKENALLVNTCMGRISKGSELEDFLHKRPDITLVMDKIAFASYPALAERAQGISVCAFETLDANQNLIDKFLINARAGAAAK